MNCDKLYWLVKDRTFKNLQTLHLCNCINNKANNNIGD